jgi:sulfite reductase (ferredoxin)
VNAHDLPSFVQDVLEIWLQKRSRFDSFAAYVDGEGLQDLRVIADKYREIPDISEDRSYYIDWDAKELFSLAGKGLGECAAGLFDLIEVDLKHAATLRDASPEGHALYTIVLCSARALLITQGVEAHSDDAVFESFRKHFILSGLIDARFERVIAAAQAHDVTALSLYKDDVSALLDAVNALYKSLDNSLRFTVQKA